MGNQFTFTKECHRCKDEVHIMIKNNRVKNEFNKNYKFYIIKRHKWNIRCEPCYNRKYVCYSYECTEIRSHKDYYCKMCKKKKIKDYKLHKKYVKREYRSYGFTKNMVLHLQSSMYRY